jgi:putative flavoprotein involved in K+ transport
VSHLDHDLIVIGGGQAGLAVAYYLRRAELDFLVLDAEERPGGAWRHAWDSLRLFSPAAYSSLPGWPMPPSRAEGFPTRDEVIDNLSRYEQRYALPIERPRTVEAVEPADEALRLRLQDGRDLIAQAVVGATGTWGSPVIPDHAGRENFRGLQLHSAHYRSPQPLAGQTVLVVGGGNSAAQILADVSTVAEAVWVTPTDPVFLPDDVDGRVLFERASARVRGDFDTAATTTLGDIVMVPPVKEARARGVLRRSALSSGSRRTAWCGGTGRKRASMPSCGARAFAPPPTVSARWASSSPTGASPSSSSGRSRSRGSGWRATETGRARPPPRSWERDARRASSFPVSSRP